MSVDEFFEDISEQSRVKTAIVSKYFDAWMKVMKPRARKHADGKLGYIDRIRWLGSMCQANHRRLS